MTYLLVYVSRFLQLILIAICFIIAWFISAALELKVTVKTKSINRVLEDISTIDKKE